MQENSDKICFLKILKNESKKKNKNKIFSLLVKIKQPEPINQVTIATNKEKPHVQKQQQMHWYIEILKFKTCVMGCPGEFKELEDHDANLSIHALAHQDSWKKSKNFYKMWKMYINKWRKNALKINNEKKMHIHT